MKKVMVGGVFSGLHSGHEFFLKKAREFGDFLVVVVASDKTLIRKKGTVDRTAEQRMKAIEDLGIADRVVVGDNEDWFRIVEKERPDVIVLGYDQELSDSVREGLEKTGLDCRIERIKDRIEKGSIVQAGSGNQVIG